MAIEAADESADPGKPFSPLGVAADPAISELAPGEGPVGVAADPAGVDAPTLPLTPLNVPNEFVSRTPNTFS